MSERWERVPVSRQFREDVLADRRAEMRELDERSPMPGGFPE